jgi:hypothetical protein
MDPYLGREPKFNAMIPSSSHSLPPPQQLSPIVGSSAYSPRVIKRRGSPPQPTIPSPPKEAQTPERHTISEDRSAGSNLEVRNLAALQDRAAFLATFQDPNRTAAGHRTRTRVGIVNGPTPAPYAGGLSLGHSQLQQRFGQLHLDEEHLDEYTDKVDQRTFEDELFTADLAADHDYLRPPSLANHDWVESIEQIDAGSGLQAKIEILQRKLTRVQKELTELEMQKQMHPNKQFQILYRIAGTCYFDYPEWTQGYKSIVSRIPVRNLDLFLEKNKNVVFVVYRDFDHAPLKTGAKSKVTLPQHTRESIHPVSRHLRKTLEMMLKHAWRYESMFSQLHRKREIDAPYLFVYHHRAHWKEMLAQCPPTVREHLNLLSIYVSENYGKEYMAADALFTRRRVSEEFVKYLFQPGDILISRSEGQYRGLVASSWLHADAAKPARGSHGTKTQGHGNNQSQRYMKQPNSEFDSEFGSEFDSESTFDLGSDIETSEEKTRSSVESIEHREEGSLRQFLRCIHPETTLKEEIDNQAGSAETPVKEFEIKIWQWSFDGEFKRIESKIVLRLSQSVVNDLARAKEWNMHDLDVYPLRFAPQSLVQKLRRRGMMFWQCRKRCLVSYQESNAEAQNEVRKFLRNELISEGRDADLRQV